MLSKEGRFEEAEGWLRRAVNGGHHDAELVLGVVLAEHGDLEEAERLFRAAADRGDHRAEFPSGSFWRSTGGHRKRNPGSGVLPTVASMAPHTSSPCSSPSVET